MIDIKIEYDGDYPNLCSGLLEVVIDGKRWTFPRFSLESGGCVSFDDDWNEEVSSGQWEITSWPKGFPEEFKESVIKKINNDVDHGCCGGCI